MCPGANYPPFRPNTFDRLDRHQDSVRDILGSESVIITCRRWSADEKPLVIEETMNVGKSIATVALHDGVALKLVYL